MMPFMSSYGEWVSWRKLRLCGYATHIKTVKFRDAVLSNELRDGRIALRHPSEELWNTHCEILCVCLTIV